MLLYHVELLLKLLCLSSEMNTVLEYAYNILNVGVPLSTVVWPRNYCILFYAHYIRCGGIIRHTEFLSVFAVAENCFVSTI